MRSATVNSFRYSWIGITRGEHVRSPLLSALSRFDEEVGDADKVIKGAVTSFNCVRDKLSPTQGRKGDCNLTNTYALSTP